MHSNFYCSSTSFAEWGFYTSHWWAAGCRPRWQEVGKLNCQGQREGLRPCSILSEIRSIFWHQCPQKHLCPHLVRTTILPHVFWSIPSACGIRHTFGWIYPHGGLDIKFIGKCLHDTSMTTNLNSEFDTIWLLHISFKYIANWPTGIKI